MDHHPSQSAIAPDEVFETHGRADILKIDTESMEQEILESIAPEHLRRIGRIYVEADFRTNPLEAQFRMHRNGPICVFEAREG